MKGKKPPACSADGGMIRCLMCSDPKKDTLAFHHSLRWSAELKWRRFPGRDQASILTDRGAQARSSRRLPGDPVAYASRKLYAKHSNGLVRDSHPTSVSYARNYIFFIHILPPTQTQCNNIWEIGAVSAQIDGITPQLNYCLTANLLIQETYRKDFIGLC